MYSYVGLVMWVAAAALVPHLLLTVVDVLINGCCEYFVIQSFMCHLFVKSSLSLFTYLKINKVDVTN